MLAIAVAATAHASGRVQQSGPTPLQLFQKLLPVIRHPRCSNCHGGVNPRSSAHQGGAITTEACETCHGDAERWEPPSPEHFFPGKSDRQLCALLSDFASKQGYPQFLHDHLERDSLIVLAFKGLIGGARTPGAGNPPDPPADPPPISHGQFVRLATDWVNQGHGACDVDGTIVQEESVDASMTMQLAPTLTQVFRENAQRTVTLSYQNGSYRANVVLTGTISVSLIQQSQNAAGRPCTITIIDSSFVSGSTTGAAQVQVRDTVLFADTDPSRGQTDYRIDVTLPPERTQRVDKNTLEDLCGTVLQAVPTETHVTTWPPHKFTIEGHLDDKTLRYLVGGCEKDVKNNEIGRLLRLSESPCFRFPDVGNHHAPWIMYHEATGSYPDGTDIPIHVMTTWNIAYRP
jgi:hypothetical protein